MNGSIIDFGQCTDCRFRGNVSSLRYLVFRGIGYPHVAVVCEWIPIRLVHSPQMTAGAGKLASLRGRRMKLRTQRLQVKCPGFSGVLVQLILFTAR